MKTSTQLVLDEQGAVSLVSFEVPGKPVPQGSMRHRRVGAKTYSVPSNEKVLLSWRNAAAAAASEAMAGNAPMRSMVELDVTFWMPRPKAHYTAKGQLRDSAPAWCPTTPDLDKLLRSLGDAMTGTVIHDDALIVAVRALKAYSNGGTRTTVSVRRVAP